MIILNHPKSIVYHLTSWIQDSFTSLLPRNFCTFKLTLNRKQSHSEAQAKSPRRNGHFLYMLNFRVHQSLLLKAT